MEIVDSGLESGYTSTSMTRHRAAWQGLVIVLVAISAAACNREAPAPVARDWRATGRSDPAFQAPSLAAGVDYTVPAEADIKPGARPRPRPLRALDAVPPRRHGHGPAGDRPERRRRRPSASTSAPASSTTGPTRWASCLPACCSRPTSPAIKSFQQYTLKNFDFIFDHLDYFRAQAKTFGPQPYGYRRLLDMRELDDCGAIGAALVKAWHKKADPALPRRHRCRRRLHLAQDDAAARRHARAQAPAMADRLVGRRVHEHSVPRADGRPDGRSRSTSMTPRIRC